MAYYCRGVRYSMSRNRLNWVHSYFIILVQASLYLLQGVFEPMKEVLFRRKAIIVIRYPKDTTFEDMDGGYDARFMAYTLKVHTRFKRRYHKGFSYVIYDKS